MDSIVTEQRPEQPKQSKVPLILSLVLIALLFFGAFELGRSGPQKQVATLNQKMGAQADEIKDLKSDIHGLQALINDYKAKETVRAKAVAHRAPAKKKARSRKK